MEISAGAVLQAIKDKSLKATARPSTCGERIGIELQADGKPFAVFECRQDHRPRATFGKTVYVMPFPGAEEGLTIECGSEVEAVRIAMELDNCLNRAFHEALGADAEATNPPTLGIMLTISQPN
ncbi:hypothetical protein [Schlesneria sp. DSM 10557]|uniref:hypothetical protein n=1 Tax=Schlesneria sp. DSM 10557 TaxID=3044399 RepID=UPI0035A06A35